MSSFFLQGAPLPVRNTIGPPVPPDGVRAWKRPEPAPAGPIEAAANAAKVTAEAFAAGRDALIYIDNTLGGIYTREEAIDRRNAAIKARLGVELENPWRMALDPAKVRERMWDAGIPGLTASPSDLDAAIRADNIAAWRKRLGELATAHADDPAALEAIGAGRDLEEDARALVQATERRSTAALDAPAATPAAVLGKYAGYFAGAVAGSLRDPVTLASLFFGAGPSAAKTAAGAIVRTALREGAMNAAFEAVSQPAIQSWRGEMGLDSGAGEAAKNIAMAAGIGGVLGGAVEGVGRALRRAPDVPDAPPAGPRADAMPAGAPPAPPATPPAQAASDLAAPDFARALEGDADALIAAARALGDDLDPGARAAAEALEAERLVRGLTPEGVAPADHDRALAQAVRAAEDPEEPLLFPLDPVPPARDPLPDGAPGQSFLYLSKPVSFRAVDAAGLGTDAATFQYKGGGDAGGVTDRLRSVERWDNMASGKVMVFERADGSQVIADGHQRLGLARRLLEEGREQAIDLNGYVFRERDGWTPSEVRAIAAKKNLQEGSGDVIDTARILRERPTILDGSVPVGSEHMRQARGLARLSDDAFGMVLNRQVAPGHAAIVGEIMPEAKGMHGFVMGQLAAADDLSAARARYMVADMARAPVRHEVQETLLGALERTVPLVVERARVLDRAASALRRERSAFRTVLANARRLEEAGNDIAEAGTAAAADQAAEAIAAIEKLALRAGPVSAALDRAAMELAAGARIGEAVGRFVDEVTHLVEARGLLGLAAEEGRPARAAMDAPVGPEAEAQARALKAALAESEPAAAAAAGSARQAEPVDRETLRAAVEAQPYVTLDELYAAAPHRQRELAGAMSEITGALGIVFKDPGVKTRATTEEKMVRKRYPSARKLTDVVRAGATVETPRQADELLLRLRERFDVLDEGWKEADTGYADRKLLVRFADGLLGEVQLWERHMRAAKDEGQKLYTERRSLSPDDPRRQALEDEEGAIYSAARDAAGDAWGPVAVSDGKGGSRPYSGSKVDRNAASEKTTVAYVHSTVSMGSQSSPGLYSTHADLPSSERSMGWRSQSRNRMEDASVPTLGLDTPETKAAGEKTLLDGVAHSEDIMLGARGCALGEGGNG